MAINIQEILHPSDSSQIKWEKVNYNFDQILANGGGPIGQKGTKGSQGSVGQTGAKGQKGDQGLKGETGTTTSRWETIPVNPGNATNPDYVILKPKLESDTYHPVIFLGDQTYDNVNNNDGLTGLRSTLVIGRHASTSDEYLTFWHGPINGTVNNVSITLESSEEVDGDGNTFVKYTLAETFGSNLNSNLNNPAETVEFSLGTDKFSIGNGTGTNVYFLGANSTFKLPESAIASPEAGMVRYYQGQYWGAVDNAGTVSWTPFCMSPCGGGGYSGTITLNPADNIEVNYDGSVYGNSIEITNGEDVEVDVNGDPWTGSSATTTQATSATTTVAAQTIEFDSVTWTPSSGVSASATSQSFLYLIDGVAGQLLNSGLVTAPSWITFSTYSGGANNNRAEFTIAENTSTNQRSGVIAITHPNNSSITDSISIIQVGVSATAATTQATAATTQATAATTQATAATTLPLYTASMANLSVSDGLEGTPTSYTWAQNGPSVITFNPSTMGEGNTTYTLVLQVGAGYSNSGQQVNVSATATGAPAYMISYDANGGTVGSGGGTGANTGGAGLTVNANSFVRDGFTFDTWNTSYMGTGTSYAPGSVPPTSAFTGTNGIYDELQLYARWSSSATSATTTASSGSGSGSGCYTYNLYNQSTTTVAGTLNNVANCSGSGNVGVFLGQYSSQSICTDAPIAQIQMSLGSIGGYNVTVSQVGAC